MTPMSPPSRASSRSGRRPTPRQARPSLLGGDGPRPRQHPRDTLRTRDAAHPRPRPRLHPRREPPTCDGPHHPLRARRPGDAHLPGGARRRCLRHGAPCHGVRGDLPGAEVDRGGHAGVLAPLGTDQEVWQSSSLGTPSPPRSLEAVSLRSVEEPVSRSEVPVSAPGRSREVEPRPGRASWQGPERRATRSAFVLPPGADLRRATRSLRRNSRYLKLVALPRSSEGGSSGGLHVGRRKFGGAPCGPKLTTPSPEMSDLQPLRDRAVNNTPLRMRWRGPSALLRPRCSRRAAPDPARRAGWPAPVSPSPSPASPPRTAGGGRRWGSPDDYTGRSASA